MKIVCHIPVRANSKRAKNKNVRRIGSLRVVEYMLNSALEAKIFDEVWLNTDSHVLISEHKSSVLKNSDCFEVYQRPDELCTDETTSDQFNFDFAKFTDADIFVMLNPVCPLLKAETIRLAVEQFLSELNENDTLITCTSTKMQAFIESRPLNIDLNQPLRPTQENKPVSTLNWAVSIWKRKEFIDRYVNKGFAVLGDRRILYDIPPLEGLKISNESDFEMIESIIKSRNQS